MYNDNFVICYQVMHIELAYMFVSVYNYAMRCQMTVVVGKGGVLLVPCTCIL